MRQISSFAEAKQILGGYVTAPSTYTLDTMRALMEHLDNPQNNLKIIHIAGTSGKTSTSYFAASLLHTAGYKVGLTTSPHIDEINERVQVDLVPLPENEYCELLGEFLDLVDASTLHPSYFELLVAFAYWVFDKKQVDYAVIEVGLGGLLDGTNVIDRTDKVCVITDIGLDHTNVLGSTIREIAAQKAGIITLQNFVFMQRQSDEVIQTITEAIDRNKATLNVIGGNFPDTIDVLYATFPPFQKRNFTLAYAATSYVLGRDGHEPLTSAQLHQALEVYIPARMEVVEYRGKTLIMDGSHNEQKIGALVGGMKGRFGNDHVAMLVSFGTLKQLSVLASLRLLRTLGDNLIITKYLEGQDEKREALDPTIIAKLANDAGFTTISVEADPMKAFELLAQSEVPVHLVTGSFYLLNHYRSLIHTPKV